MTLKISYGELQREVGRLLGFSRDPSEWDATQAQDAADILKAGQRHFYWPPSVEGQPPHLWSFLCPSAEVELKPGVRSYPMPSNYVRLRSDFTFGYDSGNRRIERVGELQIRSLWAKSAQDGVPRYCAIRSAGNPNKDGYELLVYPTPTMDAVIDYRYERAPEEITSDSPYHLGVVSHSELLLSACLMAADKTLNSESIPPDGGIHAQRFFRQLAASIVLDLQASE